MKLQSPRWLKRLFSRTPCLPSEIVQAQALIKAIDAGGIPLNPAKVNHIARNLGLDVSRRAPVEEVLERIRAALKRATNEAG